MSDATPIGAPESAAVMVMLLDDDQASRILAELEPEELRLLGEKMCALGEIGPDVIAQAIAGFVERTENLGLTPHDRLGHVRSLMTRAVGEVKADNLMARIAPDAAAPTPLELARWLTPQALVPLIAGEHPQAIAVLLVQLDPEVAAAVLHALPAETQPEIVHRIATLGPVSPEALAMLEELLTRRIAENHGQAPLAMGALLREVESDTLIDALKGTAEENREVFFRAMSSRAADGLRDEIAQRGRLKMADVVDAQKQIVAAARRLAAEGTIVFGSGDDEYV